MPQTQLEKALYLACRAFITSYELASAVNEEAPPIMDSSYGDGWIPEEPKHASPTPSSNGIPVCSRHGVAMKSGKYGYYCSQRENDPRFSNKNGYCNSKA